MKLKINKNVRFALIIIIAATAVLFSYFIYDEAYNPGFEEQTIPVYSYDNKGSINYSYNKLEEGKLYISEFVDYLDTNFKYEFTGEREADIKGEYNITAKVQGYSGEGDGIKNIWEKNYPIIQNKSFTSQIGKISISENIKLNLNEYNTFAREIKEETKINCQTVLTLSMNVNLNVNINKKYAEEFISPDLVIPLDVAMFEITGNNIEDNPGAIEETIQVKLPANKSLILTYGIILAVLITSLIILIFFTERLSDKSLLERELDKIFKKHGDRLVALNSNINVKNPMVVKSIEDLVRVSDEAGKPVLYRYSDDYNEINKFYVTDENETFVLDLSSLKVSEEIYNIHDIGGIEDKENKPVQIMKES